MLLGTLDEFVDHFVGFERMVDLDEVDKQILDLGEFLLILDHCVQIMNGRIDRLLDVLKISLGLIVFILIAAENGVVRDLELGLVLVGIDRLQEFFDEIFRSSSFFGKDGLHLPFGFLFSEMCATGYNTALCFSCMDTQFGNHTSQVSFPFKPVSSNINC
jgi:hypothetical protein